MKKFIEEFKAFISKGNVMDMAVAVIIGGAFGKIVTSLVNDIIMPLISCLTGGLNVTDWKWVIKAAEIAADGTETAETALNYGMFIQNIIDFLIVALVIFIVLKIFLAGKTKLEALKKKEEEAEEEKEPEETELDILKEIRDSLKSGK